MEIKHLPVITTPDKTKNEACFDATSEILRGALEGKRKIRGGCRTMLPKKDGSNDDLH